MAAEVMLLALLPLPLPLPLPLLPPPRAMNAR
jgi:hypothetical protein